MLTKPAGPFASDGEIASKMEEWGDSLASRVLELEATVRSLHALAESHFGVGTIDVPAMPSLADERERCAQICDERVSKEDDAGRCETAAVLASKIRSLS